MKVVVSGAVPLRECKNTEFVWELSKGVFCEGAIRSQVAVSIAVTDLLRECKNTGFVWDLSKGVFCEGAVRLLVKSFHYALNLKLFDYSSVD